MSVYDLFLFAAGALQGHRLRSGLSLLGVAIGVASVILLTSLGEGARRYVVGEFSSLGTNLLIVLPGKTETTGIAPIFGGVPHDLTLEDAEAIRRYVRPVLRVAPLTVGEAMARHGERGRRITVAGTTADFLKVRKVVVRTGRYLPDEARDRGQRVCVIGPKIQQEIFLGKNPLGQFLRLGNERFRVIGVLAPRGVSLGMDLDEVVHVPVVRAMKMFNRTGLFRVMVEVNSHEAVEPAKQEIVDLLKKRHDGIEDVTVLTQDAVLGTFTQILAALTAALAGIAAISLSVAGIGIMNVMLVSVSERVPEVGLLKALGATPRQVLASFLVEAAILSTVGGALGVAAGYASAALIQSLYPSFPVHPPHWAVASALAVSVTVGLLFGALPARRAARLDPAVALAGR